MKALLVLVVAALGLPVAAFAALLACMAFNVAPPSVQYLGWYAAGVVLIAVMGGLVFLALRSGRE